MSKLAIAVSGGVDSVALAYLISDWVKKAPLEITIINVDHNLRPESKEEAEFVKDLAKTLKFKFINLSWNSKKSTGNIQAKAREARYELMSLACKKHNIRTLLTAHHFDDQLETFQFRKERNSGILGLKPSNIHYYNDIRILRPLFNINKASLIEYVKSRNIEWREDGSNNLDKYARNRIRKRLNSLSYNEKEHKIIELNKVDNIAKDLNEELIIAIAESVSINNFGFAILYLRKFKLYNHHIQIYVLSHILTIISGNSQIPRYRNIEKLLFKLTQNIKIDNSLHGCILKEDGSNILIYREKNMIPNEIIPMKDNVIFDQRFEVQVVDGFCEKFFFITKLNLENYILIKPKLNLSKFLGNISKNNHKAILFTLPVIIDLEKIIAIPHISLYSKEEFKDISTVIFKPKFTSRFTHFF